MKALILNSGMGSRMGVLTKEHPKCMTDIPNNETILSRQLRIIEQSGIKDVVITTGYYDEVLIEYCGTLNHNLNIKFVKNPIYSETNYIYSIYCAKDYLDDDIILLHGDLVFEPSVFNEVIKQKNSCMTVSTTLPLPEKDFKAVINENQILKVGIEFFDNALAAQPLYKLNRSDWAAWLEEIGEFCEHGNRKCYAENAFNMVSDKCKIYTFDFKEHLCAEIDTCEDLLDVSNKLKELDKE